MRISYGHYVTNGSSVFSQRMLVTPTEYEAIKNAIHQEIVDNYPRYREYSWCTSVYEIEHRFPELKEKLIVEDIFMDKKIKVVFLNVFHVKFIKKYIPNVERLKIDKNTFIQVQE